MKLSRQAWVGVGGALVLAAVVGVIVFATVSSPRRRTIVPATGPDEAAARREVEQRVEQYRKAGEPIFVTDFAPKSPPPAERNAAEPLKAAMKLLDKTNDDPAWNLDLAAPAKLTAPQWQMLEAATKRFEPALALVDAADARPEVDWGITYKSPAIGILLPSLNGARQLQNALQIATLTAH